MSIIHTWTISPGGVKERDGTQDEMGRLFAALPEELSQYIQKLYTPEKLLQLNEIYLQLGQRPECIFADPHTGANVREQILDQPCESVHINIFAQFFADNIQKDGTLSSKRKGISGTLHRVSVIIDPSVEPPKVLGVTVRVGRAMEGLIQTMASGSEFFAPLIRSRQSLLIIGRPGVGKSTALREIAFLLSQNKNLIVVVVDKSKELAGDGETPHPAIGNSRWMPVGKRGMQHEIMLEAVENQSPDVIIVDEISNMQEVHAAQTIAQRGIMLIATVHGNTIPELVKDRERGSLVGGCSTVTLSGREAERRSDKRKQVLKRSKEPVFQAALELHSRTEWIFHDDIKESVDSYLDKEPCQAVRLHPGKAIRTTCIPGEGMFDYCDQCTMTSACPKHSSSDGLEMGGEKENNNNTTFSGGNPFASGNNKNNKRRQRSKKKKNSSYNYTI